MCGSSLNTEPDPQLILSESFQHSLFVMERIIAGKIFQPKLAAYRQLPMLEGKLWPSFFHSNFLLQFWRVFEEMLLTVW